LLVFFKNLTALILSYKNTIFYNFTYLCLVKK
jgi:hypothetical protein